jgi:hypothetical protein
VRSHWGCHRMCGAALSGLPTGTTQTPHDMRASPLPVLWAIHAQVGVCCRSGDRAIPQGVQHEKGGLQASAMIWDSRE